MNVRTVNPCGLMSSSRLGELSHTVVVLVSYVLPKFTKFFKEFDAELPTVTKVLLDIADFFETWWWALAVGGLVIVLLVVRANRSGAGKRRRDELLLRLPVIGSVVEYNVIERFCRIIAAMMHAGVPLPDASKAFLAVNGGQGASSARVRDEVTRLTDAVVAALMKRKPDGGAIHIEEIQDQVELALMRGGEHEVARAYVLYREKRAQERAQEKQPKAPAAQDADAARHRRTACASRSTSSA